MSDDGVITEQPETGRISPVTDSHFNTSQLQSPQSAPNSAIPLGVQQLSSLSEITVHQHLDQIEVLLGWQRPCRYSVYGQDDNNQILYIQEASECFARQCLGASRWFQLKVSDSNQQDIAEFERPFHCPLGLCCCVQELFVTSPPGKRISTIREERSMVGSQSYHVCDEDGLLFVIPTNCCYCKFCADVEIGIYDKRKEEKVCVIYKNSKGSGRECCGSQNDFTIKYLANLDAPEKMMILGASFLLDFNYFEGQRRCCFCCCI